MLRSASRFGALAQLVERFHGMEEARGSNPLSSTAATSGNGPGSGIGCRCGQRTCSDRADRSASQAQLIETGRKIVALIREQVPIQVERRPRRRMPEHAHDLAPRTRSPTTPRYVAAHGTGSAARSAHRSRRRGRVGREPGSTPAAGTPTPPTARRTRARRKRTEVFEPCAFDARPGLQRDASGIFGSRDHRHHLERCGSDGAVVQCFMAESLDRIR